MGGDDETKARITPSTFTEQAHRNKHIIEIKLSWTSISGHRESIYIKFSANHEVTKKTAASTFCRK